MGGPSETRSDRLAVRLNVGKRYAWHDVRRRVSEGPRVSPALHASLGPRSRASKDARGIDGRPQACRRKVGGTHSLQAARESLATRVVDPTLSTAERAGGGGGALGPAGFAKAPTRPARGWGGGGLGRLGSERSPPAPASRLARGGGR